MDNRTRCRSCPEVGVVRDSRNWGRWVTAGLVTISFGALSVVIGVAMNQEQDL